MKLDRRSLLKHIADTGQMAVGAMLLERIGHAAPEPSPSQNLQSSRPNRGKRMDIRAYLETILYTREEVNAWLRGDTGNHEKYDGEIGWIPEPGYLNDGVQGCRCEYRYGPSGARRMTSFPGRECRINTYGDSFTHCDQVSDGETWQERLAAHLCEPVQNFGISGNSVYQAYLRIQHEENRTRGGIIILNIHAGGYWSSQSPWASLGIPRGSQGATRRPTLPYTKANPATGEFVEYKNPCPTPESLYNLCDLDWVYERFKDEFQLKIFLARENIRRQTPGASYEEIATLAQSHGVDVQIESAEELSRALDRLSKRVSIFGNFCILERLEKFAVAKEKEIFYVLSHTVDDLRSVLAGGERFDRELVEFLARRKFPYCDDLEAHRRDFSRFKLNVQDYLNLYYNGHYTSAGNFFQAFAMKDKLVEVLTPKPPAYSTSI
jgi:hypothetical protein